MGKFSIQTKSFFAILVASLTLTVVGYYLTEHLSLSKNSKDLYLSGQQNNSENPTNLSKNTNSEADFTPLNTEDWKKFEDSRVKLSFKYPENWKIKMFQENRNNGMYVIALNPPSNPSTIRIFVSPENFYAMDGLPTKNTTISGKTALTVEDKLIGIKNESTYYTFDLGNNLKLQSEFKTLVRQAAFLN